MAGLKTSLTSRHCTDFCELAMRTVAEHPKRAIAVEAQRPVATWEVFPTQTSIKTGYAAGLSAVEDAAPGNVVERQELYVGLTTADAGCHSVTVGGNDLNLDGPDGSFIYGQRFDVPAKAADGLQPELTALAGREILQGECEDIAAAPAWTRIWLWKRSSKRLPAGRGAESLGAFAFCHEACVVGQDTEIQPTLQARASDSIGLRHRSTPCGVVPPAVQPARRPFVSILLGQWCSA